LHADGNRLRSDIFGFESELRPTENRTFAARIWLFGLIPLRPGPLARVGFSFTEVDGHRALALHQEGERSLAGVRFVPTPISPPWAARAGDYQILDPHGDQVVTGLGLGVTDGVLQLLLSITSAPAPVPMALQTLDERRAIVIGRGRNMGRIVSITNDPVHGEVLHFAGFRAVRVPERP
jgi:hypothetical protein